MSRFWLFSREEQRQRKMEKNERKREAKQQRMLMEQMERERRNGRGFPLQRSSFDRPRNNQQFQQTPTRFPPRHQEKIRRSERSSLNMAPPDSHTTSVFDRLGWRPEHANNRHNSHSSDIRRGDTSNRNSRRSRRSLAFRRNNQPHENSSITSPSQPADQSPLLQITITNNSVLTQMSSERTTTSSQPTTQESPMELESETIFDGVVLHDDEF